MMLMRAGADLCQEVSSTAAGFTSPPLRIAEFTPSCRTGALLVFKALKGRECESVRSTVELLTQWRRQTPAKLFRDLRFWPQGFRRGSVPNLWVKSNRHDIAE